MGRPKKDDGEVDFTKEDGGVKPWMDCDPEERDKAIKKAESEWNRIKDQIQALHDENKGLFANLKAEYGLKRKDLEGGFKRKAMDPDKRTEQDETQAIINMALGVPANAVQAEMFDDAPATLSGKDAAAEQSSTVQ